MECWYCCWVCKPVLPEATNLKKARGRNSAEISYLSHFFSKEFLKKWRIKEEISGLSFFKKWRGNLFYLCPPTQSRAVRAPLIVSVYLNSTLQTRLRRSPIDVPWSFPLIKPCFFLWCQCVRSPTLFCCIKNTQQLFETIATVFFLLLVSSFAAAAWVIYRGCFYSSELSEQLEKIKNKCPSSGEEWKR